MKRSGLCIVVLFLNIYAVAIAVKYPDNIASDPDFQRNVSELISSKGYPVEEHTVKTRDGFFLGIQRIPHGKSNGQNRDTTKRQVVFLQHGLLSSAVDWVINFPHQSLGFILADSGYDVWLGNARGNKYSRRHDKYTPHMRQFWNFSFDQMAQYDLPSMIDYVLNTTEQEQLFYVGHSQGTTMGFALFSESEEYNRKVNLFIALAPVATVGYITSAIGYLAKFTTEIKFLFEILGVKEFLPSNAVMKYLSELVCDTKVRFLCENIMFLLCGTDMQQLNTTRLAVYTAHTPAGTSTQSVVHYAQMVNSKNFQKYDYGKQENIHVYNQTTPPEYDVTKIKVPVAVIWSMNDQLADPTDVNLLTLKLKSVVSNYNVSLPTFNHYDYIIAIDANKLVYDQVLFLLRNYGR